jgi:hypothetical protein
MALNKHSLKADKIADLYRAAFYLANGSKEIAISFLQKSGEEFRSMNLKGRRNQIFWAEKILDRFQKLKYSLI